MTVTDEQISEAEMKLSQLNGKFQEAQIALNLADAELLVLQLKRLIEDHPNVKGVDFEMQYEYDDQGGYFQSVNLHCNYDPTDVLELIDETALGDPDDDLIDCRPTLEACQIVFKMDAMDEWKGELTREQIEDL